MEELKKALKEYAKIQKDIENKLIKGVLENQIEEVFYLLKDSLNTNNTDDKTIDEFFNSLDSEEINEKNINIIENARDSILSYAIKNLSIEKLKDFAAVGDSRILDTILKKIIIMYMD